MVVVIVLYVQDMEGGNGGESLEGYRSKSGDGDLHPRMPVRRSAREPCKPGSG